MKFKKMLSITLIVIGMIVISTVLFVGFSPKFGAASKVSRLKRIEQSPNYKEGKFQNSLTTSMYGSNTSYLKTLAHRAFLRCLRIFNLCIVEDQLYNLKKKIVRKET